MVLKKSLPLSSTRMKAGKSTTLIFQMASIPSSGYSTHSMLLMLFWARMAAGHSQHYEGAEARLKESYDYAQERYRAIQKSMFTRGQEHYFEILRHPAKYIKQALHEVRTKYSRSIGTATGVRSEWRGPIVFAFFLIVAVCLLLSTLISQVAVHIISRRVKRLQTENFRKRRKLVTALGGTALFLLAIAIVSGTTDNNFISQATKLLLVFCWMLVAIFMSLLIRLKPVKFKYGMGLYMPVIVVGFVAICCRVMFVPNTVMNILLPPLLVVCMFWQAGACRRYSKQTELTDEIVSYVTLVVLVVSSVTACLGYIFLSLLIVMWWLFALAVEETIIALYRLFHQVKERRIGARLEELRLQAEADFRKIHKGEFIRLTWLYDFIEDVVLPVFAVVSVPLSVLLALKVFDMQEIFNNLYSAKFFSFTSTSGVEILKLSASMIVLALCLYFVFRYIAYFAKSMFRDIKLRNIMQASGRTYIKDEEVNLTVANNVISILVWGTFIILLFLLFNIPTGAVSIVFAGLATGIGLAMRDVLNNFIYGIQLMSGRLRTGDWVECDGIRGKVSSVSYQSTQIETLDGAVISFLNLKAIDNDLVHTVFSFIPNTAEVASFGMVQAFENYLGRKKIDKILALGPNPSQADLEKIILQRIRNEKVALKDIKLRTFITEGNSRNDLAGHVYDITYGSIVPYEDNLVIIDDSIVRGTTLRESILRILDRLHPKKIVIVSSSPQVRYPDYYGIDMESMDQFIAFIAAMDLLRERGLWNIVTWTLRPWGNRRACGALLK